MQFPNGVTKSNLIKLGVLGAAYYMLKGRNKTQPTIENKANNPAPVDNEPADNTAANSNGTKPAKTTAFTMVKSWLLKYWVKNSNNYPLLIKSRYYLTAFENSPLVRH